MGPPLALSIGAHRVWPPVELAPMAGVTNAPYRMICRGFGAGLFVSEMVMARPIAESRNERTWKLAEFAPGESPRSLQIYATDAAIMGRAVARLVEERHVDHIDINFGCPVRKVTRHGGGAAVPARRGLLRAIVKAAVGAAQHVPVTVKFRKGLDDQLVTYLDAGRIAEDEGCAAVALHARTAEQLYSGVADWDAIATLKACVTSIPVLGNGDVWEAHDALAMVRHTRCDGVVIGRGCLGRPWLFRDLAAAFQGEPVPAPPLLGEISATMSTHARALVEWFGPVIGIREFRKHTSWYLSGYPVGHAPRVQLNTLGSLDELDDVLATLDPTLSMSPGGMQLRRGPQAGPKRVNLPEGWLDDRDSAESPGREAELVVSGG
ncbi:MAG: tRNA dihydrouridine synthase DusB [Acidimicrobiales bacterium]